MASRAKSAPIPCPIRYEVQHWTLVDGWVNTWHIEQDGVDELQTFATAEEAQAALDEHMDDIADAMASGYMDDGPDRESYRIRPVGEP